jgi:hypothetical protein
MRAWGPAGRGTGSFVCDCGGMTPTERVDTPRSSAEASTPERPHAELTGDLSIVVETLHETYDDRVGAAVVDTEIQQVADRFADATIRSFVPLFVRRYAGAKLRDHSHHSDHSGHPAQSGTGVALAVPGPA